MSNGKKQDETTREELPPDVDIRMGPKEGAARDAHAAFPSLRADDSRGGFDAPPQRGEPKGDHKSSPYLHRGYKGQGEGSNLRGGHRKGPSTSAATSSFPFAIVIAARLLAPAAE